MKKLYKDVINMLDDNSMQAYFNCNRGKLFWIDEKIVDDDAPLELVDENSSIGIRTFSTLEILSNDMTTYVARSNNKNTFLIKGFKEEAIADLEARCIFNSPEVVEWMEQLSL